MFNLSPLIASKKKLLISAFLDYCLIILLFYLLKLDFKIFKILFTVNVYAFFWILVSYIIGRYSDSQDIIISTIKKNIPNTITSLFITGIVFKIFQIINNYSYKNINLILILSLTALTSYFLGNIQNYFFNRLSSENLKWISIFPDNQEKSKFTYFSDISKCLSKSLNTKLLNANFTVLGEVNKPGKHDFLRNDMSVLEAIGIAGGLTINGKRNDISRCIGLEIWNTKVKSIYYKK